ncbi:2-succinyl-6-hydroxy-2,4-cyclohexadiene-1-carboxylate synthase [Cyanobacteria bacterium FACHB-471]|nr:2-succinyl-6-hydroxy-2,4-cyclohexadiene-1-carboxylate synthase [Cyanobacteria bacterium FACHB-471]
MEQFVNVDQYRFNYQAVGHPDHPVILFLHGFMGDCHEFDQTIALLSNHYYCLSIDLPGHGKTQVKTGDQAYTIESTAHGLIQFLEALKIQSCSLVGYSMGGRLALYLTLYFPHKFLKTVLESASPGLKTSAEREQRIQQDLTLAKKLEANFPSFLTKWYEQPLFNSLQHHSDFEKLLKQRLKNRPAQLAKSLCYLSTGCQPSLWQHIQQNTVPISLLTGELDPKFVQINHEMSQLGKLMQLRIVERCGHNIHFENAHIFAEQIQNFLSKDV